MTWNRYSAFEAVEYRLVGITNDIPEHEYNIPISSEFREDVSVMCNLSQGIVDDTKVEIIINMYENKFSLEQI